MTEEEYVDMWTPLVKTMATDKLKIQLMLCEWSESYKMCDLIKKELDFRENGGKRETAPSIDFNKL